MKGGRAMITKFLIGWALRQAVVCTYNYFYDNAQANLMY